MTPRPTLLVADDDPDFREVLRLTLGDMGFDVVEARSGDECLELAAHCSPAALFLDHRMPGMPGSLVVQKLRKDGSNVPAILVSAMDNIEEIASEIGAELWLRKPFGIDELRAVIERTGVLH